MGVIEGVNKRAQGAPGGERLGTSPTPLSPFSSLNWRELGVEDRNFSTREAILYKYAIRLLGQCGSHTACSKGPGQSPTETRRRPGAIAGVADGAPQHLSNAQPNIEVSVSLLDLISPTGFG